MLRHVRVGGGSVTVRLVEGVTVTGRVLRDGMPLDGTVVGICQLDRDAASFVGFDRIGVDTTGRFSFFNVIPDDRHLLYAETKSVIPYWVPAETLAAGPQRGACRGRDPSGAARRN